MRRYRKKHKARVTPPVTPTVTVTPTRLQTTETDTDTEKKGLERARVTRGARLSEDWQPSASDLNEAGKIGLRLYEIDNEIPKFRDYWHSRAGPNAVKRDWSATWRNWCRKAMEQKGTGNGPKLSVVDAGERLIAAEAARIGNGTGPLLDLTANGAETSDETARPLPKR